MSNRSLPRPIVSDHMLSHPTLPGYMRSYPIISYRTLPYLIMFEDFRSSLVVCSRVRRCPLLSDHRPSPHHNLSYLTIPDSIHPCPNISDHIGTFSRFPILSEPVRAYPIDKLRPCLTMSSHAIPSPIPTDLAISDSANE